MANINHVQYMRKKYGGSETLISLIAASSMHKHDIGYAKDKAKLDSEVPSYVRVIKDFEAYFKDPALKSKDIIHAHFVFPGFFSQKAGFKTVCSSHCLFSEEFKLAAKDATDPEETSELLESYEYFRNLEDLFYPQIRNLVVHSEFHQYELEKKGCNPTFLKLLIVVSDFDLGLTKEQARSIIHIPDRFTFLFLGRPTYLKGFSVFAEAFQALSEEDCQLLVVGDFELRGKRLMYSPCVRARDTGEDLVSLYVGDKVFVKPPAARDLVPLYFNAADVLVCPSFYEAVGYTSLEAMASGAFVIGSDTTGIPYIVREGETGLLFKTGDSKDLASKLRLALHDESLRESVTENAKNFIQKHDATIVLPKYEEYYNSILR